MSYVPNVKEFSFLIPEAVLAVWGLVVLTIDFALWRKRTPRDRRQGLGITSLLGVIVALLSVQTPRWLGYVSHSGEPTLFANSIVGGLFADWLNVLLLVLLAMVVGLSMGVEITEHWGEYFALLLWSAAGMMLLMAAEEFLLLFLALETMTICLFLLTAIEKDKRRSAEAGLKYFVYGSVSSALFLFGLSLLYGLTGTTRFDAILRILDSADGPNRALEGNIAGATAVVLLLVGFGFKIAAAPFHQWAPDVYEGAPAPITAWIAVGSKIASFIALMKVLLHVLISWSNVEGHPLSPGWLGLLAVMAAATMTYGNFAALGQKNFKRLLAYSSIAHAGYMLVGVLAAAVSSHKQTAAASVVYYLVVYGFTNVAAFGVAGWLARDKGREEIDDLNGLGADHPIAAAAITLLMMSLIGIPPLAGFFGKFYMFSEAMNVGEAGALQMPLVWLVFLGLFNSVVSAFYYVRVLVAVWLRPAATPRLGRPRPSIAIPLLLGAFAAVFFFVDASALTDQAQQLAETRSFSRNEAIVRFIGAEDADADDARPSVRSSRPGRAVPFRKPGPGYPGPGAPLKIKPRKPGF